MLITKPRSCLFCIMEFMSNGVNNLVEINLFVILREYRDIVSSVSIAKGPEQSGGSKIMVSSSPLLCIPNMLVVLVLNRGDGYQPESKLSTTINIKES
ncbi:hypothetical protein CEXT_500541 [Caerostris extrusa]|uniref:Uncharacterized protein n=1 Tax=Caerostris extrusa TaxID=172846 RepID=A0AAV4UJ29_CAEEX|nr:hypothetical protein CEXT_500541 [Caerostris extrusa]